MPAFRKFQNFSRKNHQIPSPRVLEPPRLQSPAPSVARACQITQSALETAVSRINISKPLINNMKSDVLRCATTFTQTHAKFVLRQPRRVVPTNVFDFFGHSPPANRTELFVLRWKLDAFSQDRPQQNIITIDYHQTNTVSNICQNRNRKIARLQQYGCFHKFLLPLSTSHVKRMRTTGSNELCKC